MKEYQGEKAIISLTSWKARINTVGKTIYSLIKQCPGFHIVLALSEEEFPQKEKELPVDLMLFINNNLIELLWVYENYKSFKKVLFTMDKYRDVPIISADDGAQYTENFADTLYKKWSKQPNLITAKTHFCHHGIDHGTGGRGILFPPYCFGKYGLKCLSKNILNMNHDDAYYGVLSKKLNIKWQFIDPLGVRINNFRVFDKDEKVALGYNHVYSDNCILDMANEIDKLISQN